MQRTEHLHVETGKLDAPRHVEAVGEDGLSERFFIHDRVSGLDFLIDTGVEISLIPATGVNTAPAELQLFAANSTPIKTFGGKRLVLDLRLKPTISWDFCIAAIPTLIIEVDLLNHYGIIVDIRARRLIEPNTGLSSNGYFKHPTSLLLASSTGNVDFPKSLRNSRRSQAPNLPFS